MSESSQASLDRPDREHIVAAVLTDPAVKECVVLERQLSPNLQNLQNFQDLQDLQDLADDRAGERTRPAPPQTELVAYVVLRQVQLFDQIEPRLHALGGGYISAFVPVARLPLHPAGTINTSALAQLPVRSTELLAAWQTRLAAVPEIDRVACLSGSWPSLPRQIHIARLLNELLPSPAASPHREQAVPSAPPEPERGPAPASVCHGEVVPQRDNAPSTLPHALCAAPPDVPLIYIEPDGSERVESYASLLQAARRFLGGLRQSGCQPGDRIIFQLDRTTDILPAFWGCLLGGFQPVIVPVPLSYSSPSRALEQLQHIWHVFEQPRILTLAARVRDIQASSAAPTLACARLLGIEILRDSPPDMQLHPAAPDDVAFYTLSSGSTGLSKAVTLTHRSILARARGTNALCQMSADDVILNWLPFDHIGSISDWHLRCIDLGCTLIYAPKDYVLGRPLRWLDLIHRYRVTHSWAPNFAYSLVSAALKDAPQGDWDLSCVQMLLTAGEAVTRATTREFLDSLAPYGLPASALQTAFGMAEVGSGVTYHRPPSGHSLTFHAVDRHSLDGPVRWLAADDETAVSFASLGPVIPGVSMRIVDEEQNVVPEGTTGRLQLKGEALTPGYYNNPEANTVFFADGWFDTGDVGFIYKRELILTGRADAGIIINGANFYNNEIEAVVEQVAGVVASFTAACGVRPFGSEAQQLAIFFHTPYENDSILRKLLRAIQRQLTKRLGIKADFLIPVERSAIPKTGIGKIQRQKLTEQFHQGAFEAIIERLDLLTANENTLPEWFYKKVWHRKGLPQRPQGQYTQYGTCLVFLDRLGLGQQIASELATFGVPCICVEPGEKFAQLGATSLSLRLDEPQDYHDLATWLKTSDTQLGSVLHLFSYTADRLEVRRRDDIDHAYQQGVGSLLCVVQALATLSFSSPLQLLVVSSHAQSVHKNEASASAKAPLSGLLQAIDQEVSWLDCQHVDCPAVPDQALAAAITQELLGSSNDQVIAYRDGQRWIAGLQHTAVSSQTHPQTCPFRRGGVYLLSNGLEGLGPHVAEFLLSRFEARLVLLDGESRPTGEENAGEAARRLAHYTRLRQLSGECVRLTLSAFETQDPAVLQRTVGDSVAGWGGNLDGIIHLTARPPECSVVEESPATFARTLVPELVKGWALSQLLQSRQPSSPSSDGQTSVFISLSSAAGVLGSPAGQSGHQSGHQSGQSRHGVLAASSAFHNGLVDGLLSQPATRAGVLRAYGFSFAAWDELCAAADHASQDAASTPMSAVVRQGFNSWLVSLQLGEGQHIVGLDANHPLVQASTFNGPLELYKTSIFFTARQLLSPERLQAVSLVDRYGIPAECAYIQLREPDSAAPHQVELWPSVAEYFVYDELIYYALANDERRNQSYRIALEKTVKDKIVLDIGTGKEAILARLALESGARKVYAIEKGDEAFEQALSSVQQLGLADQISIIHGDAAEVELPELVDVCVSEIVGPIGGCEGAAVIINDAQRFLRPGGVMIPGRSTTRIAAARLPDSVLARPGFYQVPGSYTDKIFAQIGYPFDIRLCIKNLPRTNLLSDAAVFEDLDFNHPIQLEQQHTIELTIAQESRFDGFLVWLNLETIDGEVIDIIAHEYSWLPVYMPVFQPGINVTPGDRIHAQITRLLCDTGHNPDYVISGTLIRTTGERIDFSHASRHHQQGHKQHPFYQLLFRDDPAGWHPGQRPTSPLQYLDEMPLTANGAVNRSRLYQLLQEPDQEAVQRQAPRSELEVQIAAIWQDVLEVAEVGVHDNFFELGGHSLLLVQAYDRLVQLFGTQLSLVDLFEYPTIHSLVQRLSNEGGRESASARGLQRAQTRRRHTTVPATQESPAGIAVIGMACRFPGADNLDTFWRNLAEGVESITFFTDEEIIASGIAPTVVRHPDYVKASPILSNIENFDADFFGYAARDAALMDPQHRLMLECAWETLEIAGYDPLSYPGVIGVYAGASMNTYVLNNVHPNRHSLDTNDELEVTTLDSMGGFQLMVANDKDYLPTRLSYKLNLRGPSVNVQTACSTGLVAIHMACQSLLNGEGDMFLAGGSSVQIPDRAGHLFQDGMIVSPDGHCRTFDAQAKGTIFGSGVGVVLLKRLDEALRDRDHIYAVIKGSAVNNDGSVKVGYMAPSGEGQASAVAEALAMARVSADTIGFVEAHGTGTEMGDPIEVNALSQAFRADTDRRGFCALGSVKTNVGHLQIASGMVGFIKTVLALYHKTIPPSLHFDTPNPKIDFANSPFYVNTTPLPWTASDTPRRASVNSLGIGGTNGHVVLEEAPRAQTIEQAEQTTDRPAHVLMLSAQSDTALEELAGRYAHFLAEQPDLSLADVCFTANTGRRAFAHRLAVAATSVAQLQEDLSEFASGQQPSRVMRGQVTTQGHTPLAFLFTGQGSQYVGMGRQLYETQPTFRSHLDRCAEILQPLLDRPLLDVMYPADESVSPLDETVYTQPALFALEYALAELWKSWGITPTIVIGHSLGEYAAACIAGVFELEDGLKLVAARARLMQALPQDGAMVAVFASPAQLLPFLAPFAKDVAIAAENGPQHTVISGPAQAVSALVASLDKNGLRTQNVHTSHAFHSPLMEPMLANFARIAEQISYRSPRIELVSNLSGELVTEELASAEYWCSHVRQPVKFLAGIETLKQHGCETFVEIGPRPTLLGMAARGVGSETDVWLPSLRQGQPDWQALLHSLSVLAVRAPVDWSGFERDYQRRRLPLPTYPFQRQRYWFDRPAHVPHIADSGATAALPQAGPSRLLGHKLQLPTLKTRIYENQLSPQALPFLGDHRIFDEIVVSGACHIAMLLAAAKQTFGQSRAPKTNGANGSAGAYVVKDVYFSQPLVIPQASPQASSQASSQGSKEPIRTVQVILTPEGDHQATVQLVSFTSTGTQDDPPAITHANGIVEWGNEAAFTRTRSEPPSRVWERCTTEITPEAFFQAQAERQIHLGPSYRWLAAIRRGDREAVCRLCSPETYGGLETELWHPGLLDACFGLLLATGELEAGATWLPFSIEEVRVYHEPQTYQPAQLWGHLVLRQTAEVNRVVADVRLCDQLGQPLIEFVGLEGRPARREALLQLLPRPTNALLYDIAWRPMTTETPLRQTCQQDQWLIFADQQGLAHRLAEQLRAQGARCVLVTAAQSYGRLERDQYGVNPGSAQDFARLLQDSVGEQVYSGVVYLWSVDEPSPQRQEEQDWLSTPQSLACGGMLHLVQALSKAGLSPRVWLVTRGGQPVEAESSSLHLQQTPVWGVGRTVALEHPELHCTCVDLDPTGDPIDSVADPTADTNSLLTSLAATQEESQIAWRRGMQYVARFVQQLLPPANGSPPVQADASYLITGGTGGLGLSIATWLVAQGAQHLILVSRQHASPAAAEAIAHLQKAGVHLQVVQADVSDRSALAAVFDLLQSSSAASAASAASTFSTFSASPTASANWPALRGIIHCAGIIEDGMLLEHDWQRFKKVFPAKIDGAWHLHELSQDRDLDFFVLFSSAASILGNQGQSNYAAANAFLDGLAHYRRQQGLVATSINWGPWDQVGIAVSDSAIQAHLKRLGFTALSPEAGLSVFGQVLANQVTQLTVIDWDWQTYVAQLAAPHNLFSDLPKTSLSQSPVQSTGAGSTPSPAILRQLRHARPEQRKHILHTLVHDTVRQILGLPDSAPFDPAQPLTEQGLDSLMAVQMRNAIGHSLQQALPVSLAFNYPTVNAIVDYVETLIDTRDGREPLAPDVQAEAQDEEHVPTSPVLAAHEVLAQLDKLLDEEA